MLRRNQGVCLARSLASRAATCFARSPPLIPEPPTPLPLFPPLWVLMVGASSRSTISEPLIATPAFSCQFSDMAAINSLMCFIVPAPFDFAENGRLAVKNQPNIADWPEPLFGQDQLDERFLYAVQE